MQESEAASSLQTKVIVVSDWGVVTPVRFAGCLAPFFSLGVLGMCRSSALSSRRNHQKGSGCVVSPGLFRFSGVCVALYGGLGRSGPPGYLGRLDGKLEGSQGKSVAVTVLQVFQYI